MNYSGLLKNKLFQVIICITLLSCDFSKVEYDNFEDEIYSALKTFDKKKMMLVANKITNKYYKKSGGIKFLKSKLTALTFSGEYETAFNEIANCWDTILKDYDKSYEFYIAQGLLAFKIGIDTDGFFNAALTILNLKAENVISDDERFIKCYLAIVLDPDNFYTTYLDTYNSFSDEEKYIIDDYYQSDKNERLLNSPIWFIRMVPLPDINMDSSSTELIKW